MMGVEKIDMSEQRGSARRGGNTPVFDSLGQQCTSAATNAALQKTLASCNTSSIPMWLRYPGNE
jgi:hypothetical protein